MRHLAISEFGTFLGLSGQRLIVKHEGSVVTEEALSRVRSISILKNGISISSDLISACAVRGIKLLFLDWRGMIASALLGQNQHAVVSLRKSQFSAIANTEKCCILAKSVILTKIRNQRSVIRYFFKYLSREKNESQFIAVTKYIHDVDDLITKLKEISTLDNKWKNQLFGVEGKAATLYWQTLANLELLPGDFLTREGRNAQSMTNKALNYGYTILLSYVWSAIDNAGLEVYAGILHVDRPGKPSLVLDLMEEYRAWVVDRTIVKLRDRLIKAKSFDFTLKKPICEEIQKTMATFYIYNKKRVKLENILQRQVYKFAGCFASDKKYKGYTFKW